MANALVDFGRFLKDFKSVLGWVSKAIVAGPLLGIVKYVGPPGTPPIPVAAFTALGSLLALMLAFLVSRAHFSQLVSRCLFVGLLLSILLAVFALVWYIVLFYSFSFEVPQSGEMELKGSSYHPAVGRLIGPNYTEADALREAGYDSELVWSDVPTVRIRVVLSWVLFFLLFSLAIGGFAGMQGRGPE